MTSSPFTRRDDWSWRTPSRYNGAVRCEDLVFVGGQHALDTAGVVLHPDDMDAQARLVMSRIDASLQELGASLADVVKLGIFYRDTPDVDEQSILSTIGECLPPTTRPAITVIPVPHLPYEGETLQVEAIACTNPASGTGDSRFSEGVRSGRFIFVSAQTDPSAPGDIVRQSEGVMSRLESILHSFGADLNDAVKFNIYYAGDGTMADWEIAAKVRARYFTEPGPAATGIPLPAMRGDGIRITMEVIAMLGEDGSRLPRRHSWPEGHWDWPIHLPYKHGCLCDGIVFIGGQVSLTERAEVIDSGEVRKQARTSMENIRAVLAGVDMSMGDLVKVTAFFADEEREAGLHAHLGIQSAALADPAPASTQVGLPYLAYERMMIEIEAIGHINEP
jgi:enamine deaminase RidA (YjgF/YER057c/UK114 family)